MGGFIGVVDRNSKSLCCCKSDLEVSDRDSISLCVKSGKVSRRYNENECRILINVKDIIFIMMRSCDENNIHMLNNDEESSLRRNEVF